MNTANELLATHKLLGDCIIQMEAIISGNESKVREAMSEEEFSDFVNGTEFEGFRTLPTEDARTFEDIYPDYYEASQL